VVSRNFDDRRELRRPDPIASGPMLGEVGQVKLDAVPIAVDEFCGER
jgi:hypothetical protein